MDSDITKGGGGIAGGSVNLSISGGGGGSVGATAKEVADLEDLKDIYAELEKAISKTKNELD